MPGIWLVVPDGEWRDALAARLAAVGHTPLLEPDPVRAAVRLEAEQPDALLVRAGGRRLALQRLYGELGRFPAVKVILHAPESITGSGLEAVPPPGSARMPSRLEDEQAAAWLLAHVGGGVPRAWIVERLAPRVSNGVFSLRALPRDGGVTLIYRLEAPFCADARSRAAFARTAHGAMAIRPAGVLAPDDVMDDDTLPTSACAAPAGVTLQPLCAGGPLPLAEAAHVTLSLLTALDGVHRSDPSVPVHAALCPACVWVTAEGSVLLLGVGLARLAESISRIPGQAGLPVRPWLAPEQLVGLPPDPSTDVYRASQLFHALLLGRPPFQRAGALKTLEAIGRDEWKAPPGVGPATATWLGSAMSRERAQRPQDASGAAESLRAALQADGGWDQAGARAALGARVTG